MGRLDDDQHAFRVEAAADGLTQFVSHPFLELRPPSQDIDGADEMAEAAMVPFFG